MNIKKKTLFAAFLLLCCVLFQVVQAQVLVVDATGRPILPKEYVKLKGSPYLYPDWVKGTVQMANGVVYKDIFLMYDQVTEELNFTYKDGKVQKFVDPVVGFTMGDRKFERNPDYKNTTLSQEFFEVLVDGDTKLLRRTSKKILDEVNHAVATKERSVSTTTSYFFTVPGNLVLLKNNKKTLLKNLHKHQQEVASYMEKEELSLKDEQDLVQLFTYYNTLD